MYTDEYLIDPGGPPDRYPRQVILGHRGMVGSAIHRLLPDARVTIVDADLRRFVPDIIADANVLYLCAAKVGGIAANMARPGEFIYDNLMIQANVIEASRLAGVKLIVFPGSSCIYPAAQRLESISEDQLMAGPLETTNEPYAIAKIAGIRMLEAYARQYGIEYLAVMPCNLYGPGDNYDLETSHFLPGMIRRFHEAKTAGSDSVTLWGTGTPRRELMHVDDCARIIVSLVRAGARGLVNIGPGVDYTISLYAEMVRRAVGFKGEVRWDPSRPDGVASKLLDVSRMESYGIGTAFVNHEDSIGQTYESFLKETQRK
jgi:GDP-L-fucose synthase